MKDFMTRVLSLGMGLAVASKEQLEKLADELEKKGELSKNESKEFVDKLVSKGEQASKDLEAKIRQQVQRVLEGLDMAPMSEIRRLEQRIAALEQQLAPAANAPVPGNEFNIESSGASGAADEGR